MAKSWSYPLSTALADKLLDFLGQWADKLAPDLQGLVVDLKEFLADEETLPTNILKKRSRSISVDSISEALLELAGHKTVILSKRRRDGCHQDAGKGLTNQIFEG